MRPDVFTKAAYMKHLILISFAFLWNAHPAFCGGEKEYSSGNTDAHTSSIRSEIYSRHSQSFNQPGIDLPTGGITKGRIAIESDGNVFAPDDLGAIPCGIGILWKEGFLDNIVHIGYNNNPNPDRWANTAKDQPGLEQFHEFRAIIDGTVEQFGLRAAIVFNYADSNDIARATENLTKEIDASSADNPLYIVEAGAMIYLYRAFAASDITKHQFVTVITHSGWNDIECYDSKRNENIVDILRDFTSVKFDYIVDQNRGLRGRGSAGWTAIEWMKDSTDSRIAWLYTCAKRGDPSRWGFFNLNTEVDISDAGMYYYLVTGSPHAHFGNLKTLLTKKNDID